MKPAGRRFFAEITEVSIEKQVSISMSNRTQAIVPTIPYRNTAAMVEWLCDTFDFRKRLIVKDEHGEVKHAELTFGESMIMVGAVEHSPFERLVIHPDQIGGVETQTCYLIVDDVEAHYAKVKAKNAEIIFGVRVENCGGQGYACGDPEGHLWMFGTYDPRQEQPARPRSVPIQIGSSQIGSSKKKSLLPLVLSGLVLASTAVALWSYSEMRRQTLLLDRVTSMTGTPPSHDGTARPAVEQEAKGLAASLIEIKAAKDSADQSAKDLAAQLARERAARDRAVQIRKEAQELLAQELRAKELLHRAAEQVKEQLGRERVAREAAERLAKDATDQLDHLRFAKAAAERTAEKCEQGPRSLADRSSLDAKDQL